MKKIRIVELVGFLLVLLYLAIFISNSIFKYLLDKETLVMSIILIAISIGLIFKGVLIKSGSTLWFAICLILFSIIILIFEIFDISDNYYYLFVLIPIISSLINYWVFGIGTYIKLIVLNISIAIPIFIAHFTKLEWFWLVPIGLISILLGIVICRRIYFGKEKI